MSIAVVGKTIGRAGWLGAKGGGMVDEKEREGAGAGKVRQRESDMDENTNTRASGTPALPSFDAHGGRFR